MSYDEGFDTEVAAFRTHWPSCAVDGKNNDTDSGSMLVAWFLYQILLELRKDKEPK